MAAPIINTQPQDQKVTIGGTLTLSVDATGLHTLHYQWLYQDTTSIGTDSSVYTKAGFSTDDRGFYGVSVRNTDGTTLSADATASVQPSITVQPVTQAFTIGNTALLPIGVLGYGPTYQWFKTGSPISGATGNPLDLTPFADTSRGVYKVVVYDDGNDTTSNDATLTTQTTIATQPVSQSVKFGSPVQVDVTAAGHAPFTYQWRHDGSLIAGATSRAYSIASFADDSRGVYTADVTGDGNVVASSGATLLS